MQDHILSNNHLGEIDLNPTTPTAAALTMVRDRNTSPTAVDPTVAITLALMVTPTIKDNLTALPTATATATPGTAAIRDLLIKALTRDKPPDRLHATHLLTLEAATRALNSPLTMEDSQDQTGGELH